MQSPESRNLALLKHIHGSISDGVPPSFADFTQITELFVQGYLKIRQSGASGSAVAHAMLGASLNMFDLFGIRQNLPELLRGLAESIDGGGGVH